MRTHILASVIMLNSAVATDFLAPIASTTAATTVTASTVAPILNGVTSTSLCYLWRAHSEDTAFGNCTDVDLAGITDIYTSASGNTVTIVNRNTGETIVWWYLYNSSRLYYDNYIWKHKTFSNLTEVYTALWPYSTAGAFIGFNRQTGTAECWGTLRQLGGGLRQWNCSNIDFAGVTDIYSNDYAFVLLNKNMGQAECYGDAYYGGNCSHVNFTGVTDVYNAKEYFIALNNNTRQVQCWGLGAGWRGGLNLDCTGAGGLPGRDPTSSSLNLLGVSDVYTTKNDVGIVGILALNKMAGTALCWGIEWARQDLCDLKEYNYKNYSGSCSELPNLCSGIDFAGVTDVYASGSAFLALNKNTGKAQCVGHWEKSGHFLREEADCKDKNFTGITDVYSASDFFLALNARTGETMCIGGRCSDVDLPTLEAGVTDVYTNDDDAFIAVNRLTGKARCLWTHHGACWVSPDGSWNASELYIENVVRLKRGAFIVYAPPSQPMPSSWWSWWWIVLIVAMVADLGALGVMLFLRK